MSRIVMSSMLALALQTRARDLRADHTIDETGVVNKLFDEKFDQAWPRKNLLDEFEQVDELDRVLPRHELLNESPVKLTLWPRGHTHEEEEVRTEIAVQDALKAIAEKEQRTPQAQIKSIDSDFPLEPRFRGSHMKVHRHRSRVFNDLDPASLLALLSQDSLQSIVMLVGFFAGCGVTFGVLHLRCPIFTR
eukprot:gnl/MRDRNA2_/MRDRNA2_122639_c0_seq1.p1 gnl/MRDRNA2_/MRDRNA2_122639_c0~~gnl/MRDRNA2_/MRDRNA2_122639_c0_seq1.p1  ORF type:complete len:191 (+),score=40.29 gnl/MRDRNA2_/MRDRNA2_122639_c0_seq1:177-749(+)